MKLFLSIAAISGFLAVAIGAFGAHAVKDKLDANMLDVYKTGVQYQFYHTFAIIAIALLMRFFPEIKAFQWAGWLFVVGIVLFSGSLYALSLSGTTKLGIVTPFGGLSFLAGWAMLLIGASKAI